MEKRFLDRSKRIVEKFDEFNIDGLLLTKKQDIRYVTGIPGDDCIVLITRDRKYLVTDARYEIAVSVLKPDFEISIIFDPIDFFKEFKGGKIGVQDEDLTLSTYRRLVEMQGEENIVGATGLIEALRIIKDEEEIRLLEQAEHIGDLAFEGILGFIQEGMSEKRIAAEIEYLMKLNGAEDFSFATICVSGINSSKPHGIPSDKKVEKGDFITMDFGCIYKGYCSDMTRTVAVGYATDEMRRVYDTVLRAQLNACENIKAGIHVKEGDALARDIIVGTGYGDYFGHGLGHGVGLEIHEDPYLSFRGSHILEENMSITIEPGIYLPNKFGVRIEDLAIVTKDGISNKTKSPKELIIIN